MVDHRALIGLTEHGVRPALASLTGALTCTLVADRRDTGPPDQIAVPDLGPACHAIAANVAAAPKAAATLAGLLRLTSDLPAGPGPVAESLAYSMLLAGPEFARWRSLRPPRPPAPVPAEPVLLDRSGNELRVTLNDPARHNCFSRHIRDGLAGALDVALADPSITAIRLTGAYAAAAVAAALLGPRGQLLDISMYDVAVAAGRATDADAAADGPPPRTGGPAEVVATGPGTWAVRTAEDLVPVCPPRSRLPRSSAAVLGQHTREVLAGR